MKRLCVFCGSSLGQRPVYAEAARELGELLARKKIGLVFGGGRIGLMGVVADAVLAGGGEAIGVIPKALKERELGHDGVTELRIVPSMHARKAMMAEFADGFIAMPGGFGTLDELCEILTWAQLGIHKKPCGLLNVNNFFAPLLVLFEHQMEEGFLAAKHRALLLVEEKPEPLVKALMEASRPGARGPLHGTSR
ncbi:MAG: TIGR00730 family Rossman fold protein [Acidobacteria bacterium]|nr:TIGR00730 family Rossman fold protein [Acidobacteriota bacterium]